MQTFSLDTFICKVMLNTIIVFICPPAYGKNRLFGSSKTNYKLFFNNNLNVKIYESICH